ncbi:FAD-dependent oxidoreductase [Streptomyces sp. Act143]|uniref:FAD-dependent oxidoreductase n=1 Tax=Streptomyces sp. Act143 TaxID=2200760 RepID=UPI00215A989F|nr:FAD-dependent oxidoreductase [Streptomyces sp. Act143]
MKHRIVVLGAGYAGAYVAGNLARRLSSADTEITVVNAVPEFVQRLRLHQLAAGRDIEAPRLTDVFAGTAIRLRVARVTAVDPERRSVAVADTAGGGDLGYDTLVYALGSHGHDHGVPGVAEHAFDVAARPSALRLRARLEHLGRGGGEGNVVVVGDGLTGIETATEIAETRRDLSVTLIARGELGTRLSAGARGHLRRACDRLGITVVEHTGVQAVEGARVLCADGTVLASDATVWAAGFAVGSLAAAAGLEVTGDGRIVVDRTMRSISHPDIYAVGDSVHAVGDNGRPLPMSCGSAGYTGRQAIEAIVGRLTGRELLTDDATAVSDGAGLTEKLMRFDTPQRIAAVARAGFKPTAAKRRLAGGTPAVHYALVNGAPALLFVLGDQVVGAVTFDLTGGRIATVRGIAAPARLVRLTEAWRRHGPDTPLITQW